MCYELRQVTVSIISLKTINISWLREVREQMKDTLLIIFDIPKDTHFTKYCDHYLINPKKMGFGKARRLSMLLGSELNEYCVVTDGDGQYPLESLIKIKKEILKGKSEVIIPQRMNKQLIVNLSGKTYDRRQFELLENLCLLSILKNDSVSYSFDSQPGLFAFKSSIVEKILPDDTGWLADWEITMKAIRNTKYSFLDLMISPQIQEKSVFRWRSQIEKFYQISQLVDIKEIFYQNLNLFKNPEKNLIMDTLEKII